MRPKKTNANNASRARLYVSYKTHIRPSSLIFLDIPPERSVQKEGLPNQNYWGFPVFSRNSVEDLALRPPSVQSLNLIRTFVLPSPESIAHPLVSLLKNVTSPGRAFPPLSN